MILETFLLFSHDIPSNNLGFIDPKRDNIEIEIAGHDYVLRQSPGLLASNRERGTTGAVIWKITPLLAAWLSSSPSLLVGMLHEGAVVVELGCGLAGLIGLVVSQLVRCYVLTDQEYVMKYLKENIAANIRHATEGSKSTKRKNQLKKARLEHSLSTMPLDWETDDAENLKAAIPPEASIDLLVLCDCVYNDFLIRPLVSMCADICRLGSSETTTTVVLIAQQLRSDSVFEEFLGTLMNDFDVWRVPDEKISPSLRSGSGYSVHLATLKELNGRR